MLEPQFYFLVLIIRLSKGTFSALQGSLMALCKRRTIVLVYSYCQPWCPFSLRLELRPVAPYTPPMCRGTRRACRLGDLTVVFVGGDLLAAILSFCPAVLGLRLGGCVCPWYYVSPTRQER